MPQERFMMIVFTTLFIVVFLTISGCKGRQGLRGPAVSILTAPATLQQCPTGGMQISVGPSTIIVCNGAVGSPGANGVDGSQGVQGMTGLNGSDGIDAIPITVIDLCPGITTYPGVFVEVALCLNDTLYGIYSANDGFLTMLPPGNYLSNAIGSACNLTIGAHCQVTH